MGMKQKLTKREMLVCKWGETGLTSLENKSIN